VAAILLIEDDPHQRAYAAMVLGESGHAVREAPDGQEGLRLALEKPPELIVCDVLMPGMNGYQLVAAVRREPSICTTPVILLTSLSERAQMRTGMNAGADDYLPKPFRPPELIEAVDSLLQRRKTQYEAIAGTLMQDMDAALEHQREVLAAKYETQLLQEINGKWKTDVEAGREIVIDPAVVVVADLFTLVEREGADRPNLADLLKRSHEAASDALYLFGAKHVLHHGHDIVGVFAPDEHGRPNVPSALRGTFALVSATANLLGGDSAWEAYQLAIGLSAGPVSLLRLQDPLHGDAGLKAVPGATLQQAQGLRAMAREEGWPTAVPASLVRLLPPGAAFQGRTGWRAGLCDGAVVELLRPRA
jgi:DNA-binding response OmpR family regulator